MSRVISTRLKKKEIERLEKIAEEEKIDRSALIRKFILQQIKEYDLHESGVKYRKGVVSLAEAATLAKVTIYEMMEYISRENISPPPSTNKELEEKLVDSLKLLKDLKKSL